MTRRKEKQTGQPKGKSLSAHEAGKIATHRRKAPATKRGKVRYDEEESSATTRSVTVSEGEVLAAVANNLTNQAIAQAKRVKVSTVEKHLENIYEKLDVHSRAEAAIWFLRRELQEKDRIIAELQALLVAARRKGA